MDKINLDQLQKIDIEGETLSVEEALQVLGNFANTASLEIGRISTEVEHMETDVSDKVSSDRLDEFNPDDSAAAGTIEKWASTVSGGGLPPVTSADAYSYLKVDSNGNIIAQAPIDGLGDGDFSGDLSDIPNAGAIQDLIYMIDGWTRDELNNRIDEISAENDNYKNYDIIKGNTMTGQATAQGYNLTPVTFVADTSLIETVDVILVDVPAYNFKEYIKVLPYGETNQWVSSIYIDIDATNQAKTEIDVTPYDINRMLDYPVTVTLTGYQVKAKPVQKSEFDTIMEAYFYDEG